MNIPLLQMGPPDWVGSGPPDWAGSGQPCWPPPCIPVGEYIPYALLITSILLFWWGTHYKNKNEQK